MNIIGRGGLERVINGTDRILVRPKYRSVVEAYEPEVLKHLMSNVRPGDLIADVGAHIGLYTIALAKRLSSKGHVLCAAVETNDTNCPSGQSRRPKQT